LQKLIQAIEMTKLYYPSENFSLKRKKPITAVEGISFSISKGESFGLVGESGCGKSTVGKMILRLLEPTSGKVIYNGENIFELSGEKLKELRPKLQPIFQDADSSLDPRYTVSKLLEEPFKIQKVNKHEIDERIEELLNYVNLGTELLGRHPHELSGGQRQRIGMARALALKPDFIVADEPAASLDISVQAQVLDLLNTAREKNGTGLLYISHNLRIIRIMTQRMAVMYLGKFMETGDTESIFENPLHPYTKMLIASLLTLDPEKRRTKKDLITGEPPDSTDIPSGCRFHPRCPYRKSICENEVPLLRDVSDSRSVACHFV